MQHPRGCICLGVPINVWGNTPNEGLKNHWLLWKAIIQELSYRKQIARQLRTQYVEGIHRPKYYTVTLKSRLRVTQGHWKRNHWSMTGYVVNY